MLARLRAPRLQGGQDRGGQCSRTITTELFVDRLQATDEIDNFAACIGSARGSTKMRAASEGTVFVDQAAGGLRIEKGTSAVLPRGKRLASRGFECTGRQQGLAAGQIRCFAGQFEMTALRAQLTIAFNGARGEIAIHGANLCDEGVCRRSAGWHGQ